MRGATELPFGCGTKGYEYRLGLAPDRRFAFVVWVTVRGEWPQVWLSYPSPAMARASSRVRQSRSPAILPSRTVITW